MLGFLAAVALVLFFAVLAVPFLLLRALMRRQDNSPSAEEARLVQDMYRTLGRLEKRVEVLETLLARHNSENDRGNMPPHGETDAVATSVPRA